MSKNRRLLTAESVTEGHADKVCDQIADAVLDAMLKKDPESRCACEVVATKGIIFIMGEIKTKAHIDLETIARKKLLEIGYDSTDSGMDGNACAVIVCMHEQSGDIAIGVDKSEEAREGQSDDLDFQGAGDQGIMFGYANKETETYMPMTAYLANRLSRRLAYVRKKGLVKNLRPDGKTQVSIEYENGKAKRVDAILISTQHGPDISMKELKEELWMKVVCPVIDPMLLDSETKFHVNPTGRFELGGPAADSGLTGRKLIVDTYGDRAHHGGGAFSGKDPSKVDRSAAYYARYVAKNLVAAGLCDEVEVELSYAIGRAEPFSLDVNSFGTSKLGDDKLIDLVWKVFDFRPKAIVDQLDLKRPIYSKTAAYGHFGREDQDFTWEKTDRVQDLLDALK